MTDPIKIRLATAEHAEACLAIYRPFVEHTAVSFETEVPALPEFRRRIVDTVSRLPWLVGLSGGRVAGYAYAAQFRSRPAYAWNVEVTAYVAESQRRQGVARALYVALCEGLRVQGYVNALAVITLPNPGSVAFHAALGFEQIGVFPRVGHKHGRWHDTQWWRFALRPPPGNPQAPQPVAEVARTLGWNSEE